MQEELIPEHVPEKSAKLHKAKVADVTPAPEMPAPVVTGPEALIGAAIERQLPMETIKELLAMRKELKAEAAKEAYDEAMAAFQAECPVIEKDKKVKFKTRDGDQVDYAYAPLDSIVKQVKEIIARHGFSYTFKIEEDAQGVKATCIVKHKMGHSDSSDFTAGGNGTKLMSAAQITSSKATYAKRNAFCNAFGIVTGDEDNDALKTKEEEKAEVMATKAQHDKINDLAQKAGVTMAEVVTRCRADYHCSLTEINATQAMGIIQRLELRIKNTKPTA